MPTSSQFNRTVPTLGTALMALIFGSHALLAEEPESVAPDVVQQLEEDLEGRVQIDVDARTGAVRFVTALDERGLLRDAEGLGEKEQAATFIDRYGAIFGLRSFEDELVAEERIEDDLGTAHRRYTQLHNAVTVAFARLQFHYDSKGRLETIAGGVLPNLALGVTPEVNSTAAEEIALEHARKDAKSELAESLTVRGPAELVILPTALLETSREGIEGRTNTCGQ